MMMLQLTRGLLTSHVTLKRLVTWCATVFQALGYLATVTGVTSTSLGFFLAGFIGWLTLTLFWRGHEGMLVFHIGLTSIFLGLTMG